MSKQQISIETQLLFELVWSNSQLGKEEYKRNQNYNNQHFHHKVEEKLIKFMEDKKILKQYMAWAKIKDIMTKV